MTAVVEPSEPLIPVGVVGSHGEFASATNGFQLVLPKPAPNRSEALPAGGAGRWLRDVVVADRHGYAMLSGPGWTTVVLYVDGAPVAVSRLRGNDEMINDADAAFRELHAPNVGETFAVAHLLHLEIALALSGLFAAPVWLMMTAPERTLANILERLRVSAFSGALHVGFDSELWRLCCSMPVFQSRRMGRMITG